STLGLAAAAEFGVALDRLVVVAQPPRDAWAAVVATLVEAFDVVLLRAGTRVRAGDARRLVARARESGPVLVLLDHATAAWPEAPDLRLDITNATWTGIGDGHGY